MYHTGKQSRCLSTHTHPHAPTRAHTHSYRRARARARALPPPSPTQTLRPPTANPRAPLPRAHVRPDTRTNAREGTRSNLAAMTAPRRVELDHDKLVAVDEAVHTCKRELSSSITQRTGAHLPACVSVAPPRLRAAPRPARSARARAARRRRRHIPGEVAPVEDDSVHVALPRISWRRLACGRAPRRRLRDSGAPGGRRAAPRAPPTRAIVGPRLEHTPGACTRPLPAPHGRSRHGVPTASSVASSASPSTLIVALRIESNVCVAPSSFLPHEVRRRTNSR